MDALKGLAITLIVLGHNTDFTRPLPWLFTVLYSFHVWVFLLLPFLPTGGTQRSTWLDRTVRYLTPYVLSVVAASVLFRVAFAHSSSTLAWLSTVGLALVIGSAPLLDAACGFQLYWFLPTLWSIVTTRDVLAKAPAWMRVAVWVGCFLVAASVGGYSAAVKTYVPFGVLIAAYAVWLGPLAARANGSWLCKSAAGVFVAAIGWALATAVQLSGGLNSNLAVLQLHTLARPALFMAQSAIPVLAFVTLLGLAPAYSRATLLQVLGRHSLVIYLVHSFFLQAFHRVAGRLGFPSATAWDWRQAALGAAGTIAALAGGLLVSVVIERIPSVRRRVLPRNMAELFGRRAVENGL